MPAQPEQRAHDPSGGDDPLTPAAPNHDPSPGTASTARPRVSVGALGGTIASTSAAGDGHAVTPTLSADDLAAAVPGLADLATLRAETLAMLPSPSLDEATVLRALTWARAEVADGAAGVVLTQGTDTLEESAYLLDLLWDLPEPLVVTGAMRSAQAPGADGPANLVAAISCAIAPAARGRGVLVVLADEVHAARWVAKTDSVAPGAFRSPATGPVGRYVESEVAFLVGPPDVPAPALPVPARTPGPWVPLLTTYLGDDGRALDALVAAGADGVVIAGFGAGHVSAAMAEAVGRAVSAVPIVFATRTGAGPTGRALYGYPGSEVDLLGRGAHGAGWLPPVKARLLLWTLLAGGTRSAAGIREGFDRRGGL
ncbi:asparaginase [Nocardioides sambongensis]|uniref:asparaginase n=1 Tax=Nocardioides sambongensis TaxID=2589074 RepID=UPI0018C8A053|nr:asparaginase [Nocardioides sambongensis]